MRAFTSDRMVYRAWVSAVTRAVDSGISCAIYLVCRRTGRVIQSFVSNQGKGR